MLIPLGTALALLASLTLGPVPREGAVWIAPLAGPVEVLRAFRAPAGPYAAGHRGVDLAAEPGAPVRAAGAGWVSFAGPVAGRGVVVVAHPGGLRTTYEPVRTLVRAGDPVARGAALGHLGRSEHCPEACLHWGLRQGTQYRDPMTLLEGRSGPVRLLPLDASVGGVSAGRPAWCAGRASPSSGSGTPGSRRRRRAPRPRPA